MDAVILVVGFLISTGLSIFSLYKSIKKAPFDVEKWKIANKAAEVELTDKYEKQLNAMAGYNLTLRTEIQDLRKGMDDMAARHASELADIKQRYETEMSEFREALARTERRAQLVEDWASRLCSQVESFGEIPVPFEPKSRPRTEQK
jgi:hypothetical protein